MVPWIKLKQHIHQNFHTMVKVVTHSIAMQYDVDSYGSINPVLKNSYYDHHQFKQKQQPKQIIIITEFKKKYKDIQGYEVIFGQNNQLHSILMKQNLAVKFNIESFYYKTLKFYQVILLRMSTYIMNLLSFNVSVNLD
ncbi:unnamed protein product (macronuclear) [Paramecium tetraurelia]|uniref:Transmembrane protein n=1 Tax=Paramecium tetraurelia TaxID=5888 RepID=A0E9V6_PARTE|nr:uncharacterized protein GSPATT00024804001 [Paramecium tetraurelia]CAK92073.1 unnamed protein product [Paramecium tetraurelia]|eukprot:XP_001459470.1 hypothetical protein (macronuclear) [Paramecium tetraurelia strain d4-2]